ncbi:hypothetical protein EO98_11650 [Methanosarcina sp. 2.H.T.1A.6]|nr:hypothetical protein EO94_13720 [Methanosarcina sp. 2.H.T.1A.3]KKG19280.1 hypothetical protein EO98_11650 [Methanosarcina sp. 2.H.T.1A.6]KKG20813.1 hypothetical protein EO97_19725 [Methanosarcina sp. 2.H.T.1A.15]KKG25294.1 hypothetical protein EO96_13890 [Methanosarcina sp. 2.H.T.1A.8]
MPLENLKETVQRNTEKTEPSAKPEEKALPEEIRLSKTSQGMKKLNKRMKGKGNFFKNRN